LLALELRADPFLVLGGNGCGFNETLLALESRAEPFLVLGGSGCGFNETLLALELRADPFLVLGGNGWGFSETLLALESRADPFFVLGGRGCGFNETLSPTPPFFVAVFTLVVLTELGVAFCLRTPVHAWANERLVASNVMASVNGFFNSYSLGSCGGERQTGQAAGAGSIL
jgi:hypothetical protein